MKTEMETQRHELVTFVHDVLLDLLKEYRIPYDVADQAACAFTDRLVASWGGQLINIPKDFRYKICQRDFHIYEEFNGRNHAHLARKWNLSQRAIYDIIKRVRQKGDPNQPRLFD